MFNMSKFITNKEHSRTALILCSYLQKTAAESYRLLRDAYGEHVPSHENECFGISKVVTSTKDKKEDKEHGKPPKNSKI